MVSPEKREYQYVGLSDTLIIIITRIIIGETIAMTTDIAPEIIMFVVSAIANLVAITALAEDKFIAHLPILEAETAMDTN